MKLHVMLKDANFCYTPSRHVIQSSQSDIEVNRKWLSLIKHIDMVKCMAKVGIEKCFAA
jgi:hypothetical protein